MKLHANAKLTPASRLLLCCRIEDQGRSLAEAAEAAGVSERTARKWLARYRAEGPAGLADRSSRPHRIPRVTAPERAAAVIGLRAARMTADEIAACLGMAQRTASRICARAGLGRLGALDPSEPPNRFETPRPGQLVHIDIKKLARIARAGHRVTGSRAGQRKGTGWERVHVAVDGATRMAYSEVLADERKETCCGFLERAVAWFGAQGIAVQRILTDNGPGYRSHFTGPPAASWASATPGPAPTDPAPTARPSASSRPSPSAGPTERSTAPAPSAPAPWHPGCGSTITTDHTAPSTARPRPPGLGGSLGTTCWRRTTSSPRRRGRRD
jgi:transposase